MKEIYEAPKAKFIGFAPMENLAADWDWSKKFADGDTTETTSSQIDITLPGNNPEGNF